jgi:hypothetical protein
VRQLATNLAALRALPCASVPEVPLEAALAARNDTMRLIAALLIGAGL